MVGCLFLHPAWTGGAEDPPLASQEEAASRFRVCHRSLADLQRKWEAAQENLERLLRRSRELDEALRKAGPPQEPPRKDPTAAQRRERESLRTLKIPAARAATLELSVKIARARAELLEATRDAEALGPEAVMAIDVSLREGGDRDAADRFLKLQSRGKGERPR